MHKGINSPHLLLASSNPMQMIRNLNHLLDQQELAKLVADLDKNVIDLFHLGQSHYSFASALPDQQWRQKISRLYYGVYNARRAIALKFNGSFSTDASDHKNIDHLPDALTNKQAHMINLRNMREDRNLADYNHSAVVADLVLSPVDALTFATNFINDSRAFLTAQGVNV